MSLFQHSTLCTLFADTLSPTIPCTTINSLSKAFSFHKLNKYTDILILQCFELRDYWNYSSYSSSYRPCHVAFLNISTQNWLCCQLFLVQLFLHVKMLTCLERSMTYLASLLFQLSHCYDIFQFSILVTLKKNVFLF